MFSGFSCEPKLVSRLLVLLKLVLLSLGMLVSKSGVNGLDTGSLYVMVVVVGDSGASSRSTGSMLSAGGTGEPKLVSLSSLLLNTVRLSSGMFEEKDEKEEELEAG